MTDIVERIRFLASGQDDLHSVELENAAAEIEKLRDALYGLLEHYTALANSGDAGFWDCEKESVVIAARTALGETKG